MVTRLFYAMAAMAVLAFAACEKNEEPAPEPVNGTYIGSLEVSGNGAASFTDTGIEWVLQEQSDKTYTLYMNQTRFSSMMPVYLDMEVRGMVNQASNGNFLYETASIIPFYNGTEQTNREMTNVKCEADDTYMTVTFTCMGLNATYRGTAK